LNVGSLNSLQGIDICWLEEAQNNSKVSINALLPTIRKKGSEIWASMNPKKKTDVIYDMFLTGDPPPGTVIVKVNYYDNPWFHETSLVVQMEWDKRRDPAKYRHVWLGELETRSDAIVFNNWRIARLAIPQGFRPLYGADWGFSVDPTVLTESYLFDADKLLYINAEAYKHKVQIDDLPEFFETIPGAKFNVITADSARPELISHMRSKNWRIHPSIKGKNSVIEGIEFMRTHDIVVNPDCVHTINELETYSYDIDKDGVILANLVDEKNHCIDSIRYGLEAKRRGQIKVSTRSVN
jgi:phage terminase large subunit